MPTPPLTDDELLEALRSVSEHGSITEAARVLNWNRNKMQHRVNLARCKFPDELKEQIGERTPTGHVARGVSTLYDADGNIKQQWVKTNRDEQAALEALKAAVEGMVAEVVPAKPIAPPTGNLADLLTLYTFTDYHVGMLAWHKEGGADWDLAIAEDMGVKAMAALTAGSPASKRAIVNIQGDFLHWDGLTAVTPQHGHVLDADGRFSKVVDVAIRLIRHLVAQALAKHEQVTLLICEGNHDLASSLWLRKLFGALYENEPRVTVNDSDLPYYAIEHGKTLLGFHHGHLRKNSQLPALFAAQFREAWGRCPKVYIHTGHRHHKEVKGETGAEVYQHPTLAARDAYAARGGWWSEREITALHYSARYGYAGANNVTPEMLSEAA